MNEYQDVGFFDTGGNYPDLVIENGDLKGEPGLRSYCLISMFTDSLVDTEQLPAGETDRRGWWADAVAAKTGDKTGSRLWLLDRAKTTEENRLALEDFTKECFNWMIEDGLAKSVTAAATIVDSKTMRVKVEIMRPDGKNIPFSYLWDGESLREDTDAI